jgi:hypothetical protein
MIDQKIEYKGMTIDIELDAGGSETPRDWDNMGTMVCFHGRYDLGDKHNFKESRRFPDWNYKSILPLYLYDHSGLTMSVFPFSCPWDSGQVGWIYADDKAIRAEYGVKRISKQLREKVDNILLAEVAIYDAYLTGEVYSWAVRNAEGEVIDSCHGYYGEAGYKDAIANAKIAIEIEKAA